MKRTALILLSASICLGSAFTSLAGTNPSPEEIAQWESEQDKYCFPIAQHEGKSARALTLVASDVQKYYSGFGAYGYVWGYTDVKDGESDAYHYTRVEARENGSVITQQTEYGYGYVEAETEDIEEALHRTITARVFWGE